MDKSCPSTEETAPPNPNPNPNQNSSKDHVQYLNQLNKFSHKISKPQIRKPPSSSSFDHLPQSDDTQSHPSNLQQPHQPPVYNINKNDFRDVVQKLTGSPVHDRLSAPPPIQPPKPPSSRLHRIRPPPLEHLTARPSPLLSPSSFFGGQRPVQPLSPLPPLPAAHAAAESPISAYMRYLPLSPLPPLPAVHAAAESPISAYMRYLQTASAVDSDSKRHSGLSPRWTNFGQPPAQNNSMPSPTSGSVPPIHFQTASLPLPFGCLPSSKSPYPLLSPGSLFSAVNQFGFQQFPLSPTLQISSPRWKSR